MPEGKIIKALSGFYYVYDEGRVIQCRGRGVFRKQKITPLVGDNVVYQAENDLEGYILDIETRKNELVRPPIANVDQAILVFSASQPDFSPLLLNRFLVLVEYKQIEPVILISKADLLDEQSLEEIEQYVAFYEQVGYPVLVTSAITNEGTSKLLQYVNEKVSVIAGQSGVGKSSLLNVLKPDLQLKTNEISKSLGRGKHTTRHVELIELEEGWVADTPGFSSLEFQDIEVEELSDCFPEMRERSIDCKFRGCTHVAEPKCAVKEAVENNEIPAFRYEHYKEFLQEIRDRKPRY
ncbi:ribosome small subunit-dependent GTPase A [Bacillus sp. HMF5848]|uniref:ribosome small subunit-dependent GTPase A n=1 Tax=Bacillus sp. HMF5848 TaxID=2495421 RepID=UPI000F777C0A|nr:ribosome small subunit-dependent GTPase A [Bacillus sp. HMF5848]RSK26982.1 ribosome small subunit-dependent GTPase A [Bacillus sp. HMF5848]